MEQGNAYSVQSIDIIITTQKRHGIYGVINTVFVPRIADWPNLIRAYELDGIYFSSFCFGGLVINLGLHGIDATKTQSGEYWHPLCPRYFRDFEPVLLILFGYA